MADGMARAQRCGGGGGVSGLDGHRRAGALLAVCLTVCCLWKLGGEGGGTLCGGEHAVASRLARQAVSRGGGPSRTADVDGAGKEGAPFRFWGAPAMFPVYGLSRRGRGVPLPVCIVRDMNPLLSLTAGAVLCRRGGPRPSCHSLFVWRVLVPAGKRSLFARAHPSQMMAAARLAQQLALTDTRPR